MQLAAIKLAALKEEARVYDRMRNLDAAACEISGETSPMMLLSEAAELNADFVAPSVAPRRALAPLQRLSVQESNDRHEEMTTTRSAATSGGCSSDETQKCNISPGNTSRATKRRLEEAESSRSTELGGDEGGGVMDAYAANSGAGTRALPGAAVMLLRNWMLSHEHFSHPYPTEAEKEELALMCGITLRQVGHEIAERLPVGS